MAAQSRQSPKTAPYHDGLRFEEWITDTLIKPFTEVTVKALMWLATGWSGPGFLLDPKRLEHGLEKGILPARPFGQLAYQPMRIRVPWHYAGRFAHPAERRRAPWVSLRQPIPLTRSYIGRAFLNCPSMTLLSCVAGALGEYTVAYDDTAGKQRAPWCSSTIDQPTSWVIVCWLRWCCQGLDKSGGVGV
jgi:hypothetical protein